MAEGIAPVTQLQAARRALADPALSHAEARIISHLVLSANGGTGSVFTSYRRLRADLGVSYATVAAALQKAGRHLVAIDSAKNGAMRFAIPTPGATSSEALGARLSEAPLGREALHPAERGATPSEAPRFTECSHTYDLTNDLTNENRTKRDEEFSLTPADPKPNPGEIRQQQAVQLAAEYRAKVRPGDDTCAPSGRGPRNIAKLLKTGYALDSLRAAVRNYQAACTAKGTDQRYRKACGNFFGRDAVFEAYLPANYVPPTTANAEVYEHDYSNGF